MTAADAGWPFPPAPGEADNPVALADALYSTGRRDTPTGTVIARLDPQRDRTRWLTVRRTGIGSSDMAAVLGMSKYRSELDVYMDKVGETPIDSDEAGEAAYWGTVLEEPVAQRWAELHGVKVRRIGTVAHVERRHMLCDLDRYVVGCPDHERCALEVKTRSAFKADEWKDGATPEDVEAQTMQQLAVTGLDAIHVAGLIGGQRLESRVILPDPDYIADLFTVGDEFWTDHVVAGVPPTISSLTLLEDFLKRLTPSKGTIAELDEVEQRDVKHLTRMIVAADAAKEAGDEAALKLKAIIGADATEVMLPPPAEPDGQPILWWSWRWQNSNRVLDKKALETDLAQLGTTLADYQVVPGTHRVLRKGPGVKALLEGAGDD